jgi:hypothetical protein
MPLVVRLAIVGLLLSHRDAAAQTVLTWKLTPGQTFRIERQIRQKQTVAFKNAALNQQRDSTWLVRFDVKDATTLQATFEKVRHKVSGSLDKDGMDEPLANQLEGCSFTLTVAGTGAVSKIRGLDEFWDKGAGGDAAKRKALRDAYSEKTMADAFADMLGPLPANAVSPKDTWRRETTEPIPHFGSFRNTLHFRHEGAIDARHTLRYSIEAAYQPPKQGDVPLFRVVKADLQGKDGKGTLVFDAAKSRLVSHERTMLVRGQLDLEANGRQQAVEFTSENTLSIRSIDEPAGKRECGDEANDGQLAEFSPAEPAEGISCQQNFRWLRDEFRMIGERFP